MPMPHRLRRAIVEVVDMPFGKRPFRTHIDPSEDGAEIVNGVADRVRAETVPPHRPGGSAEARQ